MANQISNTEVLAYIPEVTWGVTPATPTGRIVRHTGFSSKQDKTTVQSNEVTTSREIADIIQTQGDGGLSIPFELSYDPQFEDWLAALLGGAWTTNVLKIGTTRQSFTFQRSLSDITQFMHLTGQVPTKLSLATSMGKIITGQVDFEGKFPSVDVTTAWTALTPAGVNPVMDPIASVQLIQEGGAGAIAGATEFTMTLDNQLVNMDQLASLSPLDIQLGALVASGTFTAYTADASYWAKFAAHTQTSLNITLGGSASKKYAFQFSKVRLSKLDLQNPGKNQPVFQKYTWEAYKDATNTSVMVTRTP